MSVNAKEELKWTRTMPSLSYAFNKTDSTLFISPKTNRECEDINWLHLKNKHFNEEPICQQNNPKNVTKYNRISKTTANAKTLSREKKPSLKHKSTATSTAHRAISSKKSLQAGIEYMLKQPEPETAYDLRKLSKDKQQKFPMKWESEHKTENKRIDELAKEVSKEHLAKNIDRKEVINQSEKEGSVKRMSKLPEKCNISHNLGRNVIDSNEIAEDESGSNNLNSQPKVSELLGSTENFKLKEEQIVSKFVQVSENSITELTKAHIDVLECNLKDTMKVQEKKNCRFSYLMKKNKNILLCPAAAEFSINTELSASEDEIQINLKSMENLNDSHEFGVPTCKTSSETAKLQKTEPSLTSLCTSRVQPHLNANIRSVTATTTLMVSPLRNEVLPKVDQVLSTLNVQTVGNEELSSSRFSLTPFKPLPALLAPAIATKIKSDKRVPNANDFDVLSMSEMRAQEAAEQQSKLNKEQLKDVPELIFSKSLVATESKHDENEQSVKELLPDVSKDFKKLKTLDNNLQRIQMMLISFDDIDDICDELSKMEKLFRQEKNLILQKYAKSASALLPKSGKKSKKINFNGTEPTIATFSVDTSRPTNKKTILTNGDENILNSRRQAIKIKISPIKLAQKNVTIQLVKRTDMRKLFDDDDDEVHDKNAKNNAQKGHFVSPGTAAEQNRKRKSVQTTNKGVAIVKPMMELTQSSNSDLCSQRSSRSGTAGSRADSRCSPSRSITRSPIRQRIRLTSRPSPIRRSHRSCSRSNSSGRCGRYSRDSPPYNRRRVNFKTPRKRSPFIRTPERAGSISPKVRRPHTPTCTPPQSATALNYNKQIRLLSPLRYRRRSYSHSPPTFKPPSPPVVLRRLSSHSKRCSHSRSWSPERRQVHKARSPNSPRRGQSALSPIFANSPFPTRRIRSRRSPTRACLSHSPRRAHSPLSSRRARSPFSHKRERSPVSSGTYRSPLYADDDYRNIEARDVEDNDDLHFQQQREYYEQESMEYDTFTHSYYYNMSSHIQLLPTDTLTPPHYARSIPLAREHCFEGYTPENCHDVPYQQAEVKESVYADTPALSGVNTNEMIALPNRTPVNMPPPGIFPPYLSAPTNFIQTMPTQQKNTIKEIPKALVAVQKGNVLEIVPLQEDNNTSRRETNVTEKETQHANINLSMTLLNATPTATVLPVMSSSVHAETLGAKLKKTINMKWKEEVAQRQLQANALRPHRSKSSILKPRKDQNEEHVLEQSLGIKLKKKVFFEDGIYPNRDSGDEDRKAVIEVLARKVRRLRRRYCDDKLKAHLLAAQLEDDTDSELEKLIPPPPPFGLPSNHLKQPEYLRPLSPDTYVFFHYDPVVSSMYVSAHEHAVPPRLLDPKKTVPPTGTVAELMNSFMTPRKSSTVKSISSPYSNDINTQPTVPPPVSTLIVPLLSATRLPIRHTAGLSPSARNEFVTQPLYPSSTQFKPALPPPLPMVRLRPPAHIAPLQMKPPAYCSPVAAVAATTRNNKGVVLVPFNNKNML